MGRGLTTGTRRREGAPPSDAPSLRRLLIEEIRQADVRGTVRRDLHGLYHFYLDDEQQARLAGYGRVRRAFWMLGMLLRQLLARITPVRRLILVVALVLAVQGGTHIVIGSVDISPDLRLYAFVLVLFVLMLELKDKLLAHDEIAIAREVQRALLPSTAPPLDGWSIWLSSRPANDVGGDLVDALPLAGGRLGLALGDVSGKGMGAALLMAKLQATLRAVATGGDDLGLLGSRLNGILHRDGIDNRFATLFYAELRPAAGEVRWLNAGHNPPLVVRDGRGPAELGASAPPLGMLPGTSYSGDTIFLDPGDMLIVYSDGLTEATNPREEEFGLERLRQLAPRLRGMIPETAGSVILAEADAFLAGERAHDDLSLIIVRREAVA